MCRPWGSGPLAGTSFFPPLSAGYQCTYVGVPAKQLHELKCALLHFVQNLSSDLSRTSKETFQNVGPLNICGTGLVQLNPALMNIAEQIKRRQKLLSGKMTDRVASLQENRTRLGEFVCGVFTVLLRTFYWPFCLN